MRWKWTSRKNSNWKVPAINWNHAFFMQAERHPSLVLSLDHITKSVTALFVHVWRSSVLFFDHLYRPCAASVIIEWQLWHLTIVFQIETCAVESCMLINMPRVTNSVRSLFCWPRAIIISAFQQCVPICSFVAVFGVSVAFLVTANTCLITLSTISFCVATTSI